jgi:predicted nuclease of predicted toxin-antitoxin system
VKLFIDEDLSPQLVSRCHGRGYDATSSRDRGALGRLDHEIARLCYEEDRVLVTGNEGDFRRLCERQEIHPGLVVIPSVAASRQLQLVDAAIDHIEQRAQEFHVTAVAFMVNRVVEVGADGACVDFELP